MDVLIKSWAKNIARSASLAVIEATGGHRNFPPKREFPPDFDVEIRTILSRVDDATMTSPERIAAVIEAVRYVDRRQVAGAFVECGVWRGGSSMAAALSHHARTRELWLYDTFEGMPPPTSVDVEHHGRTASDGLAVTSPDSHLWAVAAFSVVEQNMRSTGYPDHLVKYIRGRVEDSIPKTMPTRIAVLRLDTDWYESTRHELKHLIPLMSPGSVLIIDDYGHWQGARRAVDEWLADEGRHIMLCRTDYTGRVAVIP